MLKGEALLKDWHFELGPHAQVVIGRVYGNPRFTDGKRIHSSQIVAFKHGIVETLHTYYKLEGFDEGKATDESRELERTVGESLPPVPTSPSTLRKRE